MIFCAKRCHLEVLCSSICAFHIVRLSARGKDPLSNGLHAERGAEEEEAGGQPRLTERGAGQTPSSR